MPVKHLGRGRHVHKTATVMPQPITVTETVQPAAVDTVIEYHECTQHADMLAELSCSLDHMSDQLSDVSTQHSEQICNLSISLSNLNGDVSELHGQYRDLSETWSVVEDRYKDVIEAQEDFEEEIKRLDRNTISLHDQILSLRTPTDTSKFMYAACGLAAAALLLSIISLLV